MEIVSIIIETIAQSLNNTFVCTLFAGLIIAYSGLWLYKKQKRFDIETSRKEKLHDLAVDLLTQVNVAMQDYLGQISVYDGTNPEAKLIFLHMENITPGFASKGVSDRFNKYIANISQAFNDLSTPLALNSNSESSVKELAGAIPTLNFLFSATNTLSMSRAEDLASIKKLALDHSDKVRKVLEKI